MGKQILTRRLFDEPKIKKGSQGGDGNVHELQIRQPSGFLPNRLDPKQFPKSP